MINLNPMALYQIKRDHEEGKGTIDRLARKHNLSAAQYYARLRACGLHGLESKKIFDKLRAKDLTGGAEVVISPPHSKRARFERRITCLVASNLVVSIFLVVGLFFGH